MLAAEWQFPSLVSRDCLGTSQRAPAALPRQPPLQQRREPGRAVDPDEGDAEATRAFAVGGGIVADQDGLGRRLPNGFVELRS